MMYSRFLFTAIIAGIVFTACKKSKDDDSTSATTLQITTAKDVPADTLSTGHYTFFRLKDSSIVALSDSATTKWDIGFRGTSIIVNGGTSGPGSGGAFIYNGLFTDITTISADSTFKQDNGTSLVISNWYTYTGTTTVPNHAILPLAGKVIVLRTADNKYAKLEIISYYRGNPDTGTSSFADLTTRPASRFYTFRYVYQADGSQKLN